MSISQKTLDKLYKKLQDKFKTKHELYSLNRVLGKEVVREVTVSQKSTIQSTSQDTSTATQIIQNGKPV